MDDIANEARKPANSGAAIRVVRTGPHLGAEIHGADLTRPMSDSEFDVIHHAFVEHEVIVFPDLDISDDDQIRFAERFGPLSVSPFFASTLKEGHPEFMELDNDGDHPPFKTDTWHSDETYRPMPPLGTVLLARVVPPIGGNTVFASMTAAYDGLSSRMQSFLSGLEAVHDFRSFYDLFPKDAEGLAKIHAMESKVPNPIHPVVRVHPVSGRRAIFVNRLFTRAIKDMTERESAALLELLFHLPEIPEYQFRVQWRPGTMTIWDNRSVQHYAPRDYLPHHRRMERVTISGDAPFGPADAMQSAGLADGTNRREADIARYRAARSGRTDGS